MALWHKYGWVAYLAVFVGVLGHASAEFFSVLSGIGGPELSVWRFSLGGLGLVVLALLFSDRRDLITPMRKSGVRIVILSFFGISGGYLFFHWSLDLIIGALGLWVIVGLVFDIWVSPERISTMSELAIYSLIAIAIFNTTITQFLWIGGLAAVPDITRGSYLFFLKPVIAALLAVLILGQNLTMVQSIAVLLVTFSVGAEFVVGRFIKP